MTSRASDSRSDDRKSFVERMTELGFAPELQAEILGDIDAYVEGWAAEVMKHVQEIEAAESADSPLEQEGEDDA